MSALAEDFVDVDFFDRVELVLLDLGLDVVDFVPHLVNPTLDDHVGLGGQIVAVVKSPEVTLNCGVVVVVLGGKDIVAIGVGPQFFDALELFAELFVDEVI